MFKNSGIVLPLSLALLAIGCGTDNQKSDLQETLLPELGMTVGRGFAADEKEPIRGSCIKNPNSYIVKSWINAKGIKAQLSETRVTTHESLMKEINVSASAAVRSRFYKANVNFSKFDKFTSSEDTFTWLLSVSAKSGEETLATDRINIDSLTDQAKLLVRNGDKQGFYKMCGNQFIRSVEYGGKIINVKEISAKATEQISKINADINASGGTFAWKGSASVAFSKAVEEASTRSMLKREMYQEGGPKIYYDLTVDNIASVLDKFSDELTSENSVVISVETADWDTLINFGTAEIINKTRKQILEKLYKRLWQNQEKIERIEKHIYQYENGTITVPSNQIESLRAAHQNILNQQDLINEVGINCFEDVQECKEAAIGTVIVVPQITPTVVADNFRDVELDGWKMRVPQWMVINNGSSFGNVKASWVSNVFDSKSSKGNINITVEAMSVSPCGTVFDWLSNKDIPILMTNFGEKLSYTENNYNNRTNIEFAIKKANRCFRLTFISNSPVQFSLNEDSILSKLMNKMAQSITIL